MNIVIVEDQRHLLSYYTMLLNGDPGIGEVTPCTTLKEAIKALQLRNVDILTTNLGDPVTRGIQRIETIRKRYPGVEVLVHSSNDDETVVLQAFRSGATGYLLKGGTPAELVEALYTIHRGDIPPTPAIFADDSAEIQKREAIYGSAIDRQIAFYQARLYLMDSEYTILSEIGGNAATRISYLTAKKEDMIQEMIAAKSPLRNNKMQAFISFSFHKDKGTADAYSPPEQG